MECFVMFVQFPGRVSIKDNVPKRQMSQNDVAENLEATFGYM